MGVVFTNLSQELRSILESRAEAGIPIERTDRDRLLRHIFRWVRNAVGNTNAKPGSTSKPGRPRIPDDIREIVLKLAREDEWGYTRIQGELRKLDIKSISRQTVKNILKEHDLDPGPLRGKGDLGRVPEDSRQHAFTTKKMWPIRGCVDLYFLVFIHLGTRRCWISPSTVSPESAWVCQQARNFLMHAEDVELPPRFVMRDNDAKYSAAFDAVFKASDTEIKRNARFSPNLRAHVERFIRTQQFECPDRFVVVAERHLNLINREFQHWYNHERPHSSRDHLPPGCESPPEEWATVKLNDVVCESRLGGALKSYWRRAM